MNLRWYFSALIIIFSLLGIVDQHHVPGPNQEIVLKFSNSEVSSDDVQNTISNIKSQLQELGADNILVSEGKEDGTLTITYYSDIDVAGIKKTLSENGQLAIDTSNENEGNANLPGGRDNSYNLDIYEIQGGSSSDWDLNGIHITELKPEGLRFSNPDIYAFIEDIDVTGIEEHVAYLTYSYITLSIDNTSYKTPEVRAGPCA